MGLRDAVIARTEVAAAGTSISVRGLSFADVSRLVIDHRADFLAAADIIKASNMDDMGGIASAVAQAAPILVAKVIALAADEPDLVEAAAALPMPDQLALVMAIGERTFAEPGSAPKFVASLAKMLAAARNAVPTSTPA